MSLPPCAKCQGRVIESYAVDLDGTHQERKCLNCGHRAKEEGMAKGGTCTRNHCTEPAAADSVRCPKHRDEQREQNRRYAAKAKGLPVERPTPSNVAERITAAPQEAGESWSDWKARLMADLDDAEHKLELKLAGVRRAKVEVGAL